MSNVKNKYSNGEKAKNIYSLLWTKIFYKEARLIRQPIYIRGKSGIYLGKGFTSGYRCRLETFNNDKEEKKYKIKIDDNVKIGDDVHIAAGQKIKIGKNTLIASKVFVSDVSHGIYSDYCKHSNPTVAPDTRHLYFDEVSIGENVWIGENVCVLPGVTIGNGCIIGANAVVTKSIPDFSIAVGIPAKVIKKYSFSDKRWIKDKDFK
ncbi:hexapeptide repeat-containing acetyltransferase [Eubacterium limosum]|nr:hexapeptide repeat-containing acetyltransferase [Eubacterium limosum]